MTDLRPVTHRLVGEPAEVANVLRAAQARGHLVGWDKAERIGERRVAITVTMLEPARPDARTAGPGSASPRPRRRWLRHVGIVVGALAGVAALSGVLWLLALVVQWVQAHWVPLACLGVFAALVISAAKGDRR